MGKMVRKLGRNKFMRFIKTTSLILFQYRLAIALLGVTHGIFPSIFYKTFSYIG